MRTAPSESNLEKIFHFSNKTAEQIRNAWKEAWENLNHGNDLRTIIERKHKLHHGYVESHAYARMLAIDVIGEFHGVEYLGKNSRGEDIDFVNAGDSYAPTLFFVKDRMFISTCGNLIEHGYVKEAKHSYW